MSQKPMPDIDFHLETKQEINLGVITYLGEPLTSFLGIVHNAEKKASLCVLSNVAKCRLGAVDKPSPLNIYTEDK